MNAIDRHSDRPAYKQLADLLREQILSGQLPAGEDLPSRTHLAEEHGLALATVGQALRILDGQGLILREPGRAYRVRPVREDVRGRMAAAKRNYTGSSFADQHGTEWGSFDLDRVYERVPAPARVAEALRLPAGAQVIRRMWVHAIDGVVLRVAWSYLEAARFEGTILCDMDEPPWPGGTIAQLHALGLDVYQSRLEIRTRRASVQERDLLALEDDARVLESFRTYYAGGGAALDAPQGLPVECALHVRPEDSGVIVVAVPVAERVTD